MPKTKGERTREHIVAASAPLFNRQGYAATSVADLVQATGLERGGIYRHFQGKDELAAAAFDHTLALYRHRVRSRVEAERGAAARLSAFGAALASIVQDPVVAGGCPLLNTAVETDDAPGDGPRALLLRARAGMQQMIGYAREIIEEGMAAGEFRPGLDAGEEAEMIVATFEGALMLTKLYDDPRFLATAADRLRRQAREMSGAGS
ncbi:TetR family transcriptional regulator C-terminal domain-containing protein [Longimicrobium terrae]|uniref:AcrR family transcriptional regulator n=1 Tax=Longimicrobium terrae TaxID=1639882 RepID=A0A841H4H3_9BACT|nr:TetR family transcriptional regulator [Longimicrobium terrae]MBB4638468.1 AcrR family transcriptional regulator [Longimicrobium terrae]MBB6072689.1 AcrR family transcriptional regulator [Longimicrobium terrae]NNC32437.1 TetR family transcriptional regulator [Longimicrobium terrae]